MIWRCACGAAEIEIETGDGTRLCCYCADCQAFARVSGRADILGDAGGTDLYQTVPHRLRPRNDELRLEYLRLTPKGPIRWMTACCGTPLANTLSTRQLPFASVLLHGVEDRDAFGPVAAHVNRSAARGPVPNGGLTIRQLTCRVLFRCLRARLAGRHRETPFFASDGGPAGPRRAVSEAEITAAYGREA